jgi:hypothetical protein
MTIDDVVCSVSTDRGGEIASFTVDTATAERKRFTVR